MVYYKQHYCFETLSTDLVNEGFKINLYDPCVANKEVNGNQMTVVWHVDDLKVSHKNSKEVDHFLEFIKHKYEDSTGKVKVARGRIHKYLGMTLDYTLDGCARINMIDYVKKVIEEFPEPITGVSAMPAAEHLFKINEDAKKLSEEQAEKFHTSVAKCLFLCKCARPDIMVAVAFLKTRVTAPDEDDWKKLVRLIKYLNGTKELLLTLNASKNNDVKWWVDISYAVHIDMKMHIEGGMSLGKGFPIGISRKQKLCTKSSTKAKLVGTNDIMLEILWTSFFCEHKVME